MESIFVELEDKAKFFAFVGGQLKSVEQELGDYIACTITVDEKRLQFAHADYVKNIATLTLSIGSRDPDHYKRAGALLHALNLNRPITDVRLLSDLELTDVEDGELSPTAIYEQKFSEFYILNDNEFSSFALCYNLCCHFEKTDRKYTRDYLETVCTYLFNVRTAPVDSYFILFKSLMQFVGDRFSVGARCDNPHLHLHAGGCHSPGYGTDPSAALAAIIFLTQARTSASLHREPAPPGLYGAGKSLSRMSL